MLDVYNYKHRNYVQDGNGTETQVNRPSPSRIFDSTRLEWEQVGTERLVRVPPTLD